MALTKAQLVDLNSNELILDLDADTSLHSDTDDQIDIKIGGADDFRFTANTFTALAGSGVVIPDGGLTLGSTAVTSTAAELNILDGVTSTATELNIIDGNATVGTTAFADGDGIVTNDNGTMRQTSATTLKTYIADVTLTTAAQTNITSLGTLSALTVDDVAIDGKVITMTGSTDDTFVTTVAANGATSLVTTDTAAAAANLTITADGTVGINSTGDMTLDSSTDIILDAGGGDFSFKDDGTEILRISNSSSDVIIKPIVDTKDIIFQQRDGTEVARIEDNATFNVVTGKLAINGTAITSTAAELNLLDGVSGLVQADLTKLAAIDATATELNFIDGGATIGTTAIADGDGIIHNDGGTMKVTTAATFKTYFQEGISAANPPSADGDGLGTASLEWSDLFLADGGIIYFGNDQDITLTHDADVGLKLKHTATADDKPIVLTLQTGETDMAANDVMGAIRFQAPDEGTGTDAVLVSAAIQAVSEGDFSSSSNATRLEFHTGASEAAAKKMQLTSAGKLEVDGGIDIEGGAVFNEDSADVDFRVESNGSAYAISVDAGNDTLGLFSASATQGADVQIGFHDTVTTATAMGTAHANDATLLLGGANSGATQGSIYLGGQNISADGVEGAVYGFSGGSQNAGIEFLEGSGDAYGQISMKVGQGTGGTLVETLKIDSAGHVTKPLQPAVHAYSSSAQNDIANGIVTIQLDAEVYDVNADFNTSNYTFTAPVTGKYLVSSNVDLTDIDSATQWLYGALIVTSNRNYYASLIDPRSMHADSNQSFSSSTLVDMDANDTLVLKVRSSAHGAAQMNVVTNETYMTIVLSC